MYLKRLWNNLGISNKVFFTSSILVILSTIVIYSALYSLFPRAYLFYKSTVAVNGVNLILDKYKNAPNLNMMFEELNRFSYVDNIDIMVKSNNGLVYISSRFFEDFSDSKFSPTEGKLIEEKFSCDGVIKQINFHSNAINQNLTLEIRIPLQPIEQVSSVMLIFMPIVIGITIFISIASAYFYSKSVTKPLLKINNIAKSMSKLDFSKKLEVQGNDELAELSASLNEMGNNLERNIRQLEETNKQLLSDIEKERIAEKKRREFIGTISHELKSPITIISGQLEGMIYNIGAFKDRDKYLRKSYEVIAEMRDLVGEILEINKYESEGFRVEMERINVTDMIKAAIEKQSFYAKENNIKIISDIDQCIYIYADMKLFKKVLDNIISNSVKYSKDDDIIVSLKNKDKVIIEVKNKSEELTNEELKNVFTPFYRLEKSRNRKTGGSGLGLFIVKNILDKHSNMTYGMESNNGVVTFRVEIEK